MDDDFIRRASFNLSDDESDDEMSSESAHTTTTRDDNEAWLQRVLRD